MTASTATSITSNANNGTRENTLTFANYNAHEMLYTIRRATEGYKNKEGWHILVQRALNSDSPEPRITS